jgi:hypothetical protein
MNFMPALGIWILMANSYLRSVAEFYRALKGWGADRLI